MSVLTQREIKVHTSICGNKMRWYRAKVVFLLPLCEEDSNGGNPPNQESESLPVGMQSGIVTLNTYLLKYMKVEYANTL